MKEIYPTYAEGGWSTGHRFFYKAAHRAKGDFHDSYSRYLELKQHYDDNVDPEIPEEFVEPREFTNPELEEMRQRVIQSEHVTLLYSCMAVESFINYYGVRRFGEKYFKRNLERQGITEKLSNIILAVSAKCIEPGDDIYQEVRALFETRNRLVHPKTKEMDFEALQASVLEQDTFDDVEVYVERMERILRQFCTFDPEIRWDFEFGTSESEA